MGKTKTCRKLFQTDLRKERSPYMDAEQQLSSWPEEEATATDMIQAVEKLGLAWEQPRMARVDSYRAPPLKLTLETIEEDKPKPDVAYLRSKSLPTQRRFSLDSSGHGLHRFPSYRPGQGEYLPGGCGVSMSGPILPSTYDYDSAPLKHRSRLSTRFSRVRESFRSGRLRHALNSVLSRIRPTSRRSH